MGTAGIAFALALFMGTLATPFVRKHAHRVGAVDHALSSRKLHTRPTPRLGGVAIVAAFFVPFLAFLCAGRGVMSRFVGESGAIAGFFVGAAGIAALGVYDDLRGASPKLKFLVQFGVAGLAYAAGFRILAIATPFGPTLHLGWLALPFTVVFVVGVINAINLIDGLDGLAGGVAVLAGATFFVAAALRGDVLTMWVTASLIGATLGFLVFNFNPASIFMGDTGSMFLGFMLALTAIRSHAGANGSVAMAAPVLALLVPIGDTLLSMARRALRGVPVFRGDKEHIHHKLLASGLSHRGAVLAVYAATTVLGGAALVVGSVGGPWVAASVLVAVAAAVGVTLRRLGYFDPARLNDTLVVRQRNLRMRREMAQVAAQLRGANGVDDVWTAVERAVTVLDARWASVKLVVDVDGKRRGLTVAGTEQAPPSGLTRSRHGLLAERPEKGFLELAWPVETTPGRDAEIAIETFCGQVREALEGVVERPSLVVQLRPQLYSLPPVSVGGRRPRPSLVPSSVIPSDRKAA
jgi:UDP-GlcNAc:undecaprenyl-phosphate/decaprenyl-phosphate GlcNAc-1-phosphate transferase